MSSKLKTDLISDVGLAVQAFQDATDRFDEAAARRLGLNRTDLRCLGVIAAQGPVAVGEIGKVVGLTRGAATTALDRVEKAGYATRIRAPDDRRGVLLALTEIGGASVGAIWGPMVAEGQAELAAYSEAELRFVVRFLQEAAACQLRHLAS